MTRGILIISILVKEYTEEIYKEKGFFIFEYIFFFFKCVFFSGKRVLMRVLFKPMQWDSNECIVLTRLA